MASAGQANIVAVAAPEAVAPSQKSGGRLIQLDVLRGFLLVWMTLTHLPTKASLLSNQTFGFVSGAEGFIFLSAFMMGLLEERKEIKSGLIATLRDISRRTWRIYLYHCALLVIAFTLVAHIGITYHRAALQNLLSYYLQSPKAAILSALLLEYRPSLLDILPMYIVFMLLTPIARAIAKRWSWDPVIYLSIAVWTAAQFGLRAWMYRQGDLFGFSVPENSTGAFDLYAWQLLWIVGLALGTMYTNSIMKPPSAPGEKSDFTVPRWVLRLSIAVAAVFLALRYSPLDHSIRPELYGWLIDKWHLGPARVINFTALALVLVRFGSRIAALPFMLPLATLGQASIEVFSVHVLCCLAGNALSHDADPNLPIAQQVALLLMTFSLMSFTAYAIKWRRAKKTAA